MLGRVDSPAGARARLLYLAQPNTPPATTPRRGSPHMQARLVAFRASFCVSCLLPAASVSQALKSKIFWSINIVGFIICGSTGAVSTHLAMIAGDFGLDVAQMSRVRCETSLAALPASATHCSQRPLRLRLVRTETSVLTAHCLPTPSQQCPPQTILMPCALSALVSDWIVGRQLDKGRIGLHTLFVATECFIAGARVTGNIDHSLPPKRDAHVITCVVDARCS